MDELMAHYKQKAGTFVFLGVFWLIMDMYTKSYFDSFTVGQVIAGPFAGIFQFTLVRNTGGAWGIFDGSTFVLGIVSVIICVLIMVYMFKKLSELAMAQIVGFSLIVAGGLGNAISRFFSGYVVDFIEFTFIDFPVFNMADIGVTCGLVLFLISVVVNMKS